MDVNGRFAEMATVTDRFEQNVRGAREISVLVPQRTPVECFLRQDDQRRTNRFDEKTYIINI